MTTMTTNSRTELSKLLSRTRTVVRKAQESVKPDEDTAKAVVRGELRDAIKAEYLHANYTLVYADYRDELSDAQINGLVTGNWEDVENENWEWESDQRMESCIEIIKDAAKAVIRTWEEEDDADYDDLTEDIDWKHSNEFDELRETIEERDDSTWMRDMASHSGQVMLRVPILDEDFAYGHEVVTRRRLLTDCKLPQTKANYKTAGEVLAEAGTEWSYCMVSLIASVDVIDLYDMPYDTEFVDITNPGIWVGNYGSGTGYADQFEGTIRVKREDMRTDKGAFGYGWQEVSGCHAGAYPVTFKPVPVIEPTVIQEQP